MKKSKKNIFYNILIVFFSLVIVVSLGYIVNELVIIPMQNQQSTNDFKDKFDKENNQLVTLPTSSSTTSGDASSDNQEQQILAKFVPLLEKNADTIGWLTINNTTLDHPVFYKPDGNNYYIKRDANGEYNKLGSLFMGDFCSMNPMSKVVTMYGHNMEDNDELFGQLLKFQKQSFLEENPVISFDTIYEESDWKVIGVSHADSNYSNGDNFRYTDTNYSTQEDIEEFLYQVRVRSEFFIEDDSNLDDQYMIMSTCSYGFWGERLIIVTRKVREDEKVENINIVKNNNILLPNKTYTTYGGQAPSEASLKKSYEAFFTTQN